MEQAQGRNNVQSMFGAHEIPSDNQIRNLLDTPAATGAWTCPVFWQINHKPYRAAAALLVGI